MIEYHCKKCAKKFAHNWGSCPRCGEQLELVINEMIR